MIVATENQILSVFIRSSRQKQTTGSKQRSLILYLGMY